MLCILHTAAVILQLPSYSIQSWQWAIPGTFLHLHNIHLHYQFSDGVIKTGFPGHSRAYMNIEHVRCTYKAHTSIHNSSMDYNFFLSLYHFGCCERRGEQNKLYWNLLLNICDTHIVMHKCQFRICYRTQTGFILTSPQWLIEFVEFVEIVNRMKWICFNWICAWISGWPCDYYENSKMIAHITITFFVSSTS